MSSTTVARYSEAVDSRTGRMKAHQVAGGSGGVKPPEKGKGPASGIWRWMMEGS